MRPGFPSACTVSTLFALGLVAGCFQPDPGGDGGSTGGGTDGSTGDTTLTTTMTTTSETSAETTMTTTTMTTTSESTSVDTGTDGSTGDCTDVDCPCTVPEDCNEGLACVDDVCTMTVCGDGMAQGTEQCDDMNSDDGDGCDADCTFTEIVDLAVAYTRTCVLIEGGRVRCWGYNGQGNLGYGNTDNIGDNDTPFDAGDVMLSATADQLTTGDGHNCVWNEASGEVVCWGAGGCGQLGYANTMNVGDDEFPSTLPPVNVGAVVLQVAAGGGQSCALGNAGTVRCWGCGGFGQLGYGNTNNIGDNEAPSSAGNVPVGAAITEICAGIYHSCAVLSNGDVKCWGNAGSGQLGYGNTNAIGDDETPATQGALSFAENAEHIACGLSHTCALFEGGAVRCWGANSAGQLGLAHNLAIGDNESATTLVPISLGDALPVDISAGDDHTCVLLDDQTIRCWGANSQGQLGLGNTSPVGDDEFPDQVPVIDVGAPVIQVDAGGLNTCAVLEDHTLRCWGWPVYGQNGYGNLDILGDDEVPSALPPVPLLLPP